jgi:hypothetical protein
MKLRNISRIASGHLVNITRRVVGKISRFRKVFPSLASAVRYRDEVEAAHPKRPTGRPSHCPPGLTKREHWLACMRKNCAERRERLLAAHCCIACAAPLPEGYTLRNCVPCRDHAKAKYRAARA